MAGAEEGRDVPVYRCSIFWEWANDPGQGWLFTRARAHSYIDGGSGGVRGGSRERMFIRVFPMDPRGFARFVVSGRPRLSNLIGYGKLVSRSRWAAIPPRLWGALVRVDHLYIMNAKDKDMKSPTNAGEDAPSDEVILARKMAVDFDSAYWAGCKQYSEAYARKNGGLPSTMPAKLSGKLFCHALRASGIAPDLPKDGQLEETIGGFANNNSIRQALIRKELWLGKSVATDDGIELG